MRQVMFKCDACDVSGSLKTVGATWTVNFRQENEGCADSALRPSRCFEVCDKCFHQIVNGITLPQYSPKRDSVEQNDKYVIVEKPGLYEIMCREPEGMIVPLVPIIQFHFYLPGGNKSDFLSKEDAFIAAKHQCEEFNNEQ